MVNADVALYSVIGLPLPLPWEFLQIETVPQRELPQPVIQLVRIVDDDLCTDVIAVLHPFREDSADLLLLHIVAVNHSCLMGQDYRLTFVARKTFGSKHFLRQPQFPADSAIWVVIFKNTHPCQDGMINQISL